MAVSESLRNFLQQRLSSLEQIEIVLLLRSEPGRSWTAPDVAAQLGSAPEAAAMRLFLLASSGLIVFEPAGLPRYRYEAGDPAIDSFLEELAEAYENDRAAVSAVISGPPDPVKSFADAFKLKK